MKRIAIDKRLKSLIASQAVVLAERSKAIERRDATIAKHETTIDANIDTIERQLKKLAGLERHLTRLLRKHYGPQKERIDPDQLTLFSSGELTKLAEELQSGVEDSVPTNDGSSDEDESEETASTKNSAEPKRKGHGRRPRSSATARASSS